MASHKVVRAPGYELAHTRLAMFAIDVRDAVCLARLTAGVEVQAVGLRGRPVVNHSGLFVWLREDRTGLVKVTIDPGDLPFMPEERLAAAVNNGLNVVDLNPKPAYGFAPGTTAVRGALREGNPAGPVTDAVLRLEWLDVDGVTWRGDPGRFRTDGNGQFAAFLRLRPGDEPLVAADGTVRLRLFARRGAVEKRDESSYPQGRVRDRPLAWEMLQ